MTRVRTHPDEVLREEFLAPLGMSSHQLAAAIDVPPNRISEIVLENRSVTADTALRLAKHFNTTPEFWMNLQSAHDLSKARAAVEQYKQQHGEQQMTAGSTKRSSLASRNETQSKKK